MHTVSSRELRRSGTSGREALSRLWPAQTTLERPPRDVPMTTHTTHDGSESGHLHCIYLGAIWQGERALAPRAKIECSAGRRTYSTAGQLRADRGAATICPNRATLLPTIPLIILPALGDK
jgi:hypothetical protein